MLGIDLATKALLLRVKGPDTLVINKRLSVVVDTSILTVTISKLSVVIVLYSCIEGIRAIGALTSKLGWLDFSRLLHARIMAN